MTEEQLKKLIQDVFIAEFTMDTIQRMNNFVRVAIAVAKQRNLIVPSVEDTSVDVMWDKNKPYGVAVKEHTDFC